MATMRALAFLDSCAVTARPSPHTTALVIPLTDSSKRLRVGRVASK